MMNFLKKLFGIQPVEIHRVRVIETTPGIWHVIEQAENNRTTFSSETFDSHSNAVRAAKAHVAAKRVYVED